MKVLKNLRRNFERFCYKHRNKGISNLMLYIVIGSGMVCLFNLINGGGIVYDFLVFDKAKILQGQVWRLISWVFTDTLSINPLLNILFLYFFYRLGSAVEYTIGTFKFNLFYGSGVLLMVGFAMIFCPLEDMIIGNYLVQAEDFTYLYGGMSGYLHLSLVLATLSLFLDGISSLLLCTYEKDVAALCSDVANEHVRFFELLNCLLKVDDVDAVSFCEDVLCHLGIPSSCVMSEMDACFEQLFDCDN